MLKFKRLETYYPDKKIVSLLKEQSQNEVIITNGVARAIEKTNIKQVSPVIYETKINNRKLLLCHYRNEEIKSKKFYIPSLNQVYNYQELEILLNSY